MSNSTQPHETKRETKPAAEPQTQAKPDSHGRKSPQEWAAHLGCVGTLAVPLGERYFTDYRHGMARVIHGWALHEYHEGGPPMLTLEDYQAALKTAESAPPYKPHTPAMTKYAPDEYRKA